MYKKLIAMILACTMLVSISPAVAAENASAKPTVEEILNEYHQTAFEAQCTGEADAVTAYSPRSGHGSKTLEQETVDTLNAAGYEAYNVTPTNYSTLEGQLNTDFADMGLEPEGSYIIVIHGEDPDNNNTANGVGPRAVVLPPVEDHIGRTSFDYTYNGTTYTMRYVTVTAATGSYMQAESIYLLEPNTWFVDGVVDIFSTFLIAAADLVFEKLPLGTIASLLLDWSQDDNYTALEPGTLTLHANTTWTCDILQVWNDYYSRWDSVQGSAYAVSQAYCTGFIYDPEINESVRYEGNLYSVKNTSPKYSNHSQRKEDAVVAYTNGTKSYDGTGDIDFFLGDEEGEVIYGDGNSPLFTHYEEWSIV